MQKIKPIRIMIVDNHKGVRVGLTTYLESQAEFELVAEASSGEEAITSYINDKPDLVLMDLFLPDTSGIILMHNLHLINSRIPVIMLTSSMNPHLEEAVMSAGAACVVDKSVSGKKLVSAISETMDKIEIGSAWLSNSTGDNEKLEKDTKHVNTEGSTEGSVTGREIIERKQSENDSSETGGRRIF